MNKESWRVDSCTSSNLIKVSEYFGSEKQLLKLVEELDELKEAIINFTDGKDTKEHVIEEIADVENLLYQITDLWDCSNFLNIVKDYKAARTVWRLNEGTKYTD